MIAASGLRIWYATPPTSRRSTASRSLRTRVLLRGLKGQRPLAHPALELLVGVTRRRLRALDHGDVVRDAHDVRNLAILVEERDLRRRENTSPSARVGDGFSFDDHGAARREHIDVLRAEEIRLLFEKKS